VIFHRLTFHHSMSHREVPLIGLGQTAPVEGTDRLTAGKTYAFFCSIHPGMRGQLAVR
jgi:plastocyanin